MDVRRLALIAGDRTRIVQPGRFFMLLEAGGPLDITFEVNNSPIGELARNVEAGYQRFPGDWADPQDGQYTSVILTSATAQNVQIGISQQAADYKRTVGIVQIDQPNAIVTVDDVAVTVAVVTIAVANTSRREIHIQNLGPGNIRLGETGITAGRGLQLLPGQPVTLTTTAEIRAILETATLADVTVTEETRV